MVYSLTLGSQVESMIGKSGIVWAMDGDVPAMLFYIVSDDEFGEVDITKHFTFALKKVDNIIFICSKCGSTQWYSAPVNPHLTEDYVYDAYDKKIGKQVEFYVVNSANGLIEKTGAFALSPEFSKKLEDEMKELAKEDFDRAAYQANVKKAYETYKTDEDIAKEAEITCEINR